jgi:hypothetical protein
MDICRIARTQWELANSIPPVAANTSKPSTARISTISLFLFFVYSSPILHVFYFDADSVVTLFFDYFLS